MKIMCTSLLTSESRDQLTVLKVVCAPDRGDDPSQSLPNSWRLHTIFSLFECLQSRRTSIQITNVLKADMVTEKVISNTMVEEVKRFSNHQIQDPTLEVVHQNYQN